MPTTRLQKKAEEAAKNAAANPRPASEAKKPTSNSAASVPKKSAGKKAAGNNRAAVAAAGGGATMMPYLGSNVIPETPRSSVAGNGGVQVPAGVFMDPILQMWTETNEAFLSRINAEKKLSEKQYEDLSGQLAGHNQELKRHDQELKRHDQELNNVRSVQAEQGRAQADVIKSAHKEKKRMDYLLDQLGLDYRSPDSDGTEKIGK